MQANTKTMTSLYTQCFSMPKIELHAHLNGCIRKSTLLELAGKKGIDLSKISDNFGKDLERCFQTFAAVHKICDSLKVIERIAAEMIEDFAKENVVYLEIRTTPKEFPAEGTSIVDYIRAVAGVMKKYEDADEHFRTRLIISVNRATSYATAESSVNAAIALKSELSPYIVGVDFGGDPHKSEFKDFSPLFTLARKAGLKTTVHTAEIVNYTDNDDILAFKPERLGHAVLLSPVQQELVRTSGIPIECCPTCYLSILGHSSYTQTPNLKWMKESGHTFSLGTDNTLLFNTNATGERFEIAHAFEFSREDMLALEAKAAEMIFDEALKPWLIKQILP